MKRLSSSAAATPSLRSSRPSPANGPRAGGGGAADALALAMVLGMLPGWMAGHYRAEDCRIDLRPRSPTQPVCGSVSPAAIALDAERRMLQDDTGTTHDFDLLSLDVGSLSTRARLDALPTDTLLAVKP